MARAIDADELLAFLYSESAGTDEQLSDWIEECGLSDAEVIDRAKKLCWTVIEGFINVIKTAPTLTPPNEPLTLEELRQMRGKPVWTVTTGFNGSGRWELVCDVDCEDALEMASCVDGFYDIDVNTYGSTWLAYRRPPEGEEDT